ncbi:hypothetical protein W824_00245 [Clavibacter cf. michiganensis LMG 26808]|nr:hypothetical protein W824_00245 [Clavibacter cf. michiganensis LMG 26808]
MRGGVVVVMVLASGRALGRIARLAGEVEALAVDRA